MLNNGKQIPESILNQAIDFAINFTNTCHHGKEEESLFPTLEKKGMPREGRPIARMLYEHEITKELANSIVNSTKIYIDTGKHDELVKNIDEYVQHVCFCCCTFCFNIILNCLFSRAFFGFSLNLCPQHGQ